MIRDAVPADLDALLALRRLMFEAMGTDAVALQQPAWQEASRDWFRGLLATADARVLVVDDGDGVLAAAVAEVKDVGPSPECPRGRIGLLSNIATFPRARGRGWGRALTVELLRWLEDETDVSRVDLHATPAGARIYAALGFAQASFPAMRRPVPLARG